METRGIILLLCKMLKNRHVKYSVSCLYGGHGRRKLQKTATEMIEGVTAVALQGQTKKGGSFHLGEVKLNLTYLMFEKNAFFIQQKW